MITNILERIRSFFSNASMATRHWLFLFMGLCLVGILSRVIAIHASLWEWDDILFAQAMHEYDLERHIPHPPGFPVFIMMGRLAYAFFKNEHHALVAVNVLFASILAPALYLFYGEIFRDRWIALTGALFAIFSANVWLHSGGPRSDIPGFVIGVTSLTLAIYGMRSPRAFVLSCALLGVGIGVRVTVLPAVAPTVFCVLIFHFWKRHWRLVGAAVVTAVVCFLVWYIPLILHTTWRMYQIVMSSHAEFTVATDSIFSDGENSVLAYRLRRFFLDIWGARSIAWSLLGLALLGLGALLLERRWSAIGWMTIAFVPYLTFVFTLNTPLSAPLYSFPYIPLFVGFAACGSILVPRLAFDRLSFLKRLPRSKTLGRAFAVALPVLLLIGMIVWAYPVVRMVRGEVSPPLRAMQHLRKTLNPERDSLVYDGLFSPHIRFLLPDQKNAVLKQKAYARVNLIDPVGGNPVTYGLTTSITANKAKDIFRWSQEIPARRLRMITLGRYFDVYISDLSKQQHLSYLSGWYQEESDGNHSWRWMGRKSKIALLNSERDMFLRLRALTPQPPFIKQPPVVRISIDSRQIAAIKAGAEEIDQTWAVQPDPARLWSVLTIETDQFFVPRSIGASFDDRELGLQCFSLEWYPAPETKPLITSGDQFLGSGWFLVERGLNAIWRWTTDRAIVHLPPIDSDGQLTLTMSVPESSVDVQSDITVTISGEEFDKFRATAALFKKTYRIPARLSAARAELQLSTPAIVKPPDTRSLGLCVYEIDWTPAPD